MAIKRLERLSTEHGARDLMQRLVTSGRCTLEQLDHAPPAHINPTIYRNLLRDPEHYAEPKVKLSEQRDFNLEPESAETPLPY